jgi:hypothetical protein
MWRVAFDAAAYSQESAAQAGAFLATLCNKLVELYNNDAGFGQTSVSTNVFIDW